MNKIVKVVLCIILISSVIYLSIIGYRHYDYNQGYAQALIREIRDFDDEALNKLLENPKNIDSTPSLRILINDSSNANPLEEAAFIGNYNAVVALVEAGANVNFINPTTDFTPLLNALYSNKPDQILIANYLIDHGADVHYSTNSNGNISVLEESINYYGIDMEESYSLFLRLISLDCDPYVKTGLGNIFLKSALEKNKLVMVYLLENEMFDINGVGYKGYSALMLLSLRNIDELVIEMVNILLEYGADKTLVSEEGLTAYDYALETGNTELIELLRFE
ncbi:ankyrin repeat domain-containing protein [Paracholeplasma manati]|uniref:ankyrin repeat domain-containing protein n=1 Tax=Paracholeplasma manati TaxID=591373 RepID=UPI002407C32E|nr:hypothetical protein [Paracholeplasma manati]MDG0889298.1 hypothetical protein [Paracholeplasma manati]